MYLYEKCEKIILTKPDSTPNLIEARGIGLIEVPIKNSAELFCFVKMKFLRLMHALCLL